MHVRKISANAIRRDRMIGLHPVPKTPS
jgi:hypothetical protein